MSTFRGWPEQKTYEGIEGAREFIRTWADAWDEWELHVVGLHDAGGREIRMQMYADPAEAIEAAGLTE
jgi:hypothetical protein